MEESLDTVVERYYKLLHWQLSARLPRPSGVHIYSKGALIKGFQTRQTANAYELIISDGIPYGRYAMGYDDNGNKKTPRIPMPTKNRPNPTHLEEMNFRTIDDCIETTSKVIAELGGVTVNGNRI